MPILTCIFNPSVLELLGDDTTQESVQDAIDQINEFTEDPFSVIDEEVMFHCDNLTDEQGKFYLKLGIVPQVAYVVDGRLYVESGNLTVDLTSRAEVFTQALPHLPKESDLSKKERKKAFLTF